MIKKLPDELIIATLTSLSESIISFCSTNHCYRELYNATNILQYIVELGKAGCEDLGCKVISPFHIPSEEFRSSRERRSYWKPGKLAGAVWTFAEWLLVYV